MSGSSLNERDLRALRVLRGAAHAGGFSAAEQLLNMTTATISRQIKSVEERLGVRLCLRGPQGFELTQAGQVALKHAEKALDALDSIRPAVLALQGEITGKLKIGIIENTISYPGFRIYKAIDKLYEMASSISVSIKVMARGRLMRALIEHEIDIMIEGMHERNTSLNYMHLFYEPQSIYRLDNSAVTDPLPMVMRPEHVVAKKMFDKYKFKIGPEANSIESVAMFIATGRFCGILPEHYADTLSQKIPLCRIDNAPEIRVEFCAVTDPRRELPLCAKKFMEILVDECTPGRRDLYLLPS